MQGSVLEPPAMCRGLDLMSGRDQHAHQGIQAKKRDWLIATGQQLPRLDQNLCRPSRVAACAGQLGLQKQRPRPPLPQLFVLYGLRPILSDSQPKNTQNGVPISNAAPINIHVVVASSLSDWVRKYIA